MRKYKIKLGLIVGLIFLLVISLFGFFTYMVFWQKTYYSVSVQGFYRDNENITEAYEKEKNLRQLFQNDLATERVKRARDKSKMLQTDSLLKVKNNLLHQSHLEAQKMQSKLKQIEHERDSIKAVIRSLQRVPE